MAERQNREGAIVLTPTARLARAARRRLATERRGAGEAAWRAPDILPLSAWLADLRHRAVIAGAVDAVPISSAQARLVWQEAIDTDIFVGEPRVAEMAQRAWRTLHEYRLQPPGEWPELLLSEDARRFREWAGRFEALCDRRGIIDEWAFAARLPDLIADDTFDLPARVEIVGQELAPTPLQQALYEALESAGVDVVDDAGPPASPAVETPPVDAFAEPDDELRAAASWARQRLAAEPRQSVAVVVPDLGNRLDRVERIFRRVFDPPGFALSARGAEPWHVSLGRALSGWPLAADALAILELDPARIAQSRAAALLRSPFLPGWSDEPGPRAHAVARLMEDAPYEITAVEWARDARGAGAGGTADRIEDWRATRREHARPAWPSEWVRRFQLELDAIGFGSGRALDSREYQLLKRWHELLDEFGALDVAIDKPLSRGSAVSTLVERARATTFRERDPGCPVEVLGVEEALGSRFDAVWITTLDADTWPGPARRDPLIPGPVQAGVPTAHGDGCLARARAELDGLLRAGRIVRGSFSTGTDDQPRECTPLLGDVKPSRPEPPGLPEPAGLDHIERDVRAPRCAGQGVRGGTAVLRDQSACPFRAFAARRLGAKSLRPPRPGLDAAARGILIHKALELFWADLDGGAALAALAPDDRQARIEQAAEQALDAYTRHYFLRLSAGARALEARCTARAVTRWLAIEQQRGAFRVVERERRVEMRFGELQLSGTIDRVDETGAGTVLIDYKTGRSGRNAWMPEARIADPQLPAYALAMEPRPAAIAFARIRPEDMKFEGLAESDPEIPGVTELAATGRAWKAFDDWRGLFEAWRGHLDALAADFVEGRAPVLPRDDQACRNCDLHALCRIHERQPVPVEDDG